ncbi:MAG: hypothetical protein F6K00_26430 [Leptolyngbya sp. SIOISBB]|nr:hypothetical protein [Leptolyngbya sp. SIOISBB]
MMSKKLLACFLVFAATILNSCQSGRFAASQSQFINKTISEYILFAAGDSTDPLLHVRYPFSNSEHTLENSMNEQKEGGWENYAVSFDSISSDLPKQRKAINLENKLETIKSDNGTCTLTFRYPQLSGFEKNWQADINRILKQQIVDFTSTFYLTVSEHEGCTEESDLDHLGMEVDPCIVTFAQKDIVSFFCHTIRAGRSAYPISSTKGITLNLRTGKIYEFSDLFKENSNYQKRVSGLILEQYDALAAIDAELLAYVREDETFYLHTNCPDSSISSTCLAIPTNFTSGALRGMVSYINIEDLTDILNSSHEFQIL